jgi:hypothetical protein
VDNSDDIEAVPDGIEAVLAAVRRAVRLDEAETRKRVIWATGLDGDCEVVFRREWVRHEQRCAALKREERRILDLLVQLHIDTPMKSIVVDAEGNLTCVP